MVIQEILKCIRLFLDGESTKEDAYRFSTEMKAFLEDAYPVLIKVEDADKAKQLMKSLPEICGEYKEGGDVEGFREKVREEYDRLLEAIGC